MYSKFGEFVKWLNYHHLYYFLRIAELGSISKAAEVLKTGQPGLSSQLKELEANIGTLFERRNRALHLTERGMVVFKYAKEIFSRGDELLMVLERGELAISREIVVGVQEGVPKAIIAQTLVKISKRYQAKIKFIEGHSVALLEELNHGKIDFVIFDEELSHPGGTIFYFSVGKEKLCVWGSLEYKNLDKNFPKSVSGVPFISTPLGHPLRQQIEHFFLSKEINLNVMTEAPDSALIKEMAVHGTGLVVLGETTVKAWVQAGRLHKIGNLPLYQRYWIGIPKRSLKDPLGEVLLREFSNKDK
jgi:LysR family transcriptional activator of nhaA